MTMRTFINAVNENIIDLDSERKRREAEAKDKQMHQKLDMYAFRWDSLHTDVTVQWLYKLVKIICEYGLARAQAMPEVAKLLAEPPIADIPIDEYFLDQLNLICDHTADRMLHLPGKNLFERLASLTEEERDEVYWALAKMARTVFDIMD